MMLSSVDLPPPDGPVMMTNEPGSTWKAMFLRTRLSGLSPTARNTLLSMLTERGLFTAAICWPSR
jgi:hypothetical protein